MSSGVSIYKNNGMKKRPLSKRYSIKKSLKQNLGQHVVVFHVLQVFLDSVKPDWLYFKLNNSLICGKNYESYLKRRAKKYLVQNVF